MEQPDEIHVDAMQYKVINRMPPENAQALREAVRRLYEIFAGGR